MRREPLRWLPAALLFAVLAGCAHQRPVVYPDATAQRRGDAAVAQAVDACMARAEAYGLDYSDGDLARRTAEGGLLGGAGGAAAGAIYGDIGRGALAGAASGATIGLIRGLFRADAPHPVYRRFVNRCLAKRGFEPIGWR